MAGVVVAAPTAQPACVGVAWQAGPVRVIFDAELWLWDARRADAWVFAGLPAGESEEIRDLAGGLRRGFGSLRVRATIGSSAWTTSIFPGRAVLTSTCAIRRYGANPVW